MTPLRNSMAEVEVVNTKRPDETAEEKKARRKTERKRRQQLKLLHSLPESGGGSACSMNKNTLKRFNKLFNTETAFVSEVLKVLPEVKNPHLFDDEDDKMENFLLDEEGAKQTELKREEFLAKMRRGKDKSEEPTRAMTHEELKERLHAKMASLIQKRNEKKHLRKLKKLEMQKLHGSEESSKKKKFISKANPNLKNQKGQSSGLSIKDDKDPSFDSNTQGPQQPRTPLRKKPVVKSNGEIVYSKFDFISEDKRQDGPNIHLNIKGKSFSGSGKGKASAEDLLKSVQKTQTKVARLETLGKQEEAVTLVETQKWDSALRRAQGEKIRDDPTLLKKTIKKQEKRKQVSKKQWGERTDRVEKQKKEKQDKRKANIQARKEEKVKKVKKQQRKKGRLA